MKLGIVVVYLVQDRDLPLFALHLRMIERYTEEPYTIYACANRAVPACVEALRAHPRVKLIDIPATSLRDAHEHAYYLDRLVASAFDDSATHVCTLHNDSFPVREGWAGELERKLSERCVLAAAVAPHALLPRTECFFFAREFYERLRPAFIPPGSVCQTPEYQAFRQGQPPWEESGNGFAFAILQAGLEWYPLSRKTHGPARRERGTLNGDLVFHLGGATRTGRREANGAAAGWAKLADRLRRLVRNVIPRRYRNPLRRNLGREFWSNLERAVFCEDEKALLADPEAYIARLR